MNKNVAIILGIIALCGIGYITLHPFSKSAQPQEPSTVVSPAQDRTATDAIVGCYVAHLGKDVYTLHVATQNNDAISGTLAFNNFEKDSSHGTFEGTYKNSIILADFSFASEGMQSLGQVTFKKVGKNFIQGFGPITMVGDKATFTDTATVSYNQDAQFVPEKCQ